MPGDTTRPITDRVKESLFNILGADIGGATFLDLFAGTGSVGIEALSRGAAFVQFLDSNHLAVRTIRTNLADTGLVERGRVSKGNAFEYLKRSPDRRYDYIYVAPPQYKGIWREALTAIDAYPGWLAEDAWVIVQIHPREYAPTDLIHLDEIDQRKYGSTLLVFYGRKNR